ncbi:hypothetical protein ACSSS7_004612 [Eimeria intestinalis]
MGAPSKLLLLFNVSGLLFSSLSSHSSLSLVTAAPTIEDEALGASPSRPSSPSGRLTVPSGDYQTDDGSFVQGDGGEEEEKDSADRQRRRLLRLSSSGDDDDHQVDKEEGQNVGLVRPEEGGEGGEMEGQKNVTSPFDRQHWRRQALRRRQRGTEADDNSDETGGGRHPVEGEEGKRETGDRRRLQSTDNEDREEERKERSKEGGEEGQIEGRMNSPFDRQHWRRQALRRRHGSDTIGDNKETEGRRGRRFGDANERHRPHHQQQQQQLQQQQQQLQQQEPENRWWGLQMSDDGIVKPADDDPIMEWFSNLATLRKKYAKRYEEMLRQEEEEERRRAGGGRTDSSSPSAEENAVHRRAGEKEGSTTAHGSEATPTSLGSLGEQQEVGSSSSSATGAGEGAAAGQEGLKRRNGAIRRRRHSRVGSSDDQQDSRRHMRDGTKQTTSSGIEKGGDSSGKTETPSTHSSPDVESPHEKRFVQPLGGEEKEEE